MKVCHNCGAEWVSDKRQPGFKEICESCSAYLHCCRNCRFHDKTAHNQCQVSTAEWVSNKTGLNFCDDFQFIDRVAESEKPEPLADDTGKALEQLFGSRPKRSEADQLEDFKKLFPS